MKLQITKNVHFILVWGLTSCGHCLIAINQFLVKRTQSRNAIGGIYVKLYKIAPFLSLFWYVGASLTYTHNVVMHTYAFLIFYFTLLPLPSVLRQSFFYYIRFCIFGMCTELPYTSLYVHLVTHQSYLFPKDIDRI